MAGTGCVSRTVHQRVVEDLDAATRQSKMFSQEISALKGDQANAGKELEACRAQADASAAQVNGLKSQLETTQTELSQTRQALEQSMKGGSASAQLRAKGWLELQVVLAPMVKPGQLEVRLERGLMSIVVLESVLFDPEKADLKPEGKKVLVDLGKVLQGLPTRVIQVEGHTDNGALKPGGKFSDLRALSQARALEVARGLEGAGVSGRNLSVAGWGDIAPAYPNDTADNRARNRRISLVFLPTADELLPLDPASSANK